jgi:hypothetical protein
MNDVVYWVALGVILVIVLLYALRSDRTTAQKPNQMVTHLQTFGIQAEVIQKKEKYDRASSSKAGMIGIVSIHGGDVQRIEIRRAARNGSYKGQYFAHRFVLFLSSIGSQGNHKGTKLITSRNSMGFGGIEDLKWKGDGELPSILNADVLLNDHIISTGLADAVRNRGMEISPDFKSGVAFIVTHDFLPTHEQFKVIEAIAKHVKAVW